MGLGTWRSIRHHHNPEMGAHGVSQMDPARSEKDAASREQGELVLPNKSLFCYDYRRHKGTSSL